MRRRERWEILGLILALLADNGSAHLPLSRIAQRANLPYDRFVDHLAELRSGGLVTADDMPGLTEKGRDLLKSWRQWEAVLERFGLD
ncbi:MAG TPA: winged helix-turn-helix domain-containing protein [Candidatus Thermoplasmatota archaeon]|nr:winged helix-turn-helix domain-containing protein [Candidatus Thermoplasmatota archaeon]